MSLVAAEGTHLFFVDDEAVLLDESAQKLFQLNTTAAFVWMQIEQARSHEEIRARLQATFSLSPETAASYLRQTEQLLHTLGVLRGPERAAAAPTEDRPNLLAPNLPEHIRFVAERRYALLSSRLLMRFTDASSLATADAVLRHLADDDFGRPTSTLDIVRCVDGGTCLMRDDSVVLHGDRENKLGPLIKSLIWQTAILEHRFFIDIHAAVVGDGRQCFLFPAASGSGKSTLFAALVHAGFEYFSDEVALLHEDDLRVGPVPLALCVKHSGMDAVARYFPEVRAAPEFLRGDGKRVRYLRPPPGTVPPAQTLRPVGAIIFPRYLPGHATRLENIGRMDALQSLMRECLIVDTRLDAERVARLLDWMARMPCHRLNFSDTDDAVAAVRKLTRKIADGRLSCR